MGAILPVDVRAPAHYAHLMFLQRLEGLSKSGDETQSGKAEEGPFAAYRPLISPDLFWAKSISSLECGGDDGTRTRGLCRDSLGIHGLSAT